MLNESLLSDYFAMAFMCCIVEACKNNLDFEPLS